MRAINKNIFHSSNCLSQDELIRYHQNKMSDAEKHLIEQHLTDCELCSEALEGVALLADVTPIQIIRAQVTNKYGADKKEIRIFSNPKLWYAAASVIVIFVFGSLYFNAVKNDKQVTESAAYKMPEQNSDMALKKNLPQQPNVQHAAVADTVVQLVSSTSRKVAEKNYEAAKKYEEKRSDAGISSDNFLHSNQMPHGAVIYKDENQKAESDNKEIELDAIIASGTNAEPPAESKPVLANFISNHKFYNYQPVVERKKEIELDSKNKRAPEKVTAVAATAEASSDKNTIELGYMTILTDALALYDSKQYKQAINKFDELLKINPDDVNAFYYSALCYKEQNKLNKALDCLNKLNGTNTFFQQDAQWQRALIFIEQNQIEKANELLQKIISTKGTYTSQAKDKLQTLKK